MLDISLDMIFAVIATLQIGIAIGVVIGERRSSGVFKPFVDDYRKQKREMWLRIKKKMII